jgi:hypothetical protein
MAAGCAAGIKGRADRPTYLASSTSYYASDIKVALGEAKNFKDSYYEARTTSSYARMKELRNDFAYKMMQAHELSLQDYARSLSVEGRGGAFATTLAVLGLSSAATIINNSSTQSILSGISTGLLGARESYSKDVLAEKAVDFVLVRITAAHLNERAKILKRLPESPLTYPLSAIELDLDNLSRVSSFEVALSDIAASVETTLDNANNEVEDVTSSFKFSQNEFTPDLESYFDIDDDVELARRVEAGKNWLSEKKITVDLFVFISDAAKYGDRYKDFVDQVILK